MKRSESALFKILPHQQEAPLSVGLRSDWLPGQWTTNGTRKRIRLDGWMGQKGMHYVIITTILLFSQDPYNKVLVRVMSQMLGDRNLWPDRMLLKRWIWVIISRWSICTCGADQCRTMRGKSLVICAQQQNKTIDVAADTQFVISWLQQSDLGVSGNTCPAFKCYYGFPREPQLCCCWYQLPLSEHRALQMWPQAWRTGANRKTSLNPGYKLFSSFA